MTTVSKCQQEFQTHAYLVAPVDAILCGKPTVQWLPRRGCTAQPGLLCFRKIGWRECRGRDASCLALQHLTRRLVRGLWSFQCSSGRLGWAWERPSRGALILCLRLGKGRHKVGRRALCTAIQHVSMDSKLTKATLCSTVLHLTPFAALQAQIEKDFLGI